jgi:hypothetical protein
MNRSGDKKVVLALKISLFPFWLPV